jgi:hypothetical protein
MSDIVEWLRNAPSNEWGSGQLLKAAAEIERLRAALAALLVSSKMLLENSHGCAINHYGEDYSIHGCPGWLSDCQRDVEAADKVLSK